MMTTDAKKEQRKKQVETLKSHWKEVFETLGLSKAYYYPKPVMRVSGEEPFINLFPTELEDPNGVYTEVVDFSLNPESERKLLRFRHNPHYKDEYELMSTRIGDQYKIPFDEFEEIKIARPKNPITTLEEVHADQLTARDWACIHLKVPESNKPWLNDLIKKAK